MTPARAIRLAMMGGVLLFGGVSWFLHRLPDWEAPDPMLFEQLVRIAPIVALGVVLGLAFLFLKFRNTTNAAQASTVAILAWSLGETLALFGGVIFYLTAASGWYIAGVIALALSFVAFPPLENR